jgi:hypothetical protein
MREMQREQDGTASPPGCTGTLYATVTAGKLNTMLVRRNFTTAGAATASDLRQALISLSFVSRTSWTSPQQSLSCSVPWAP